MLEHTVRSVKEIIIGIRVPRALRTKLERERKRASRKAGADVKLSSLIRAILEQHLREA
jgi:hypothetical protein